jgi:hypothetical protein
MLQLSDFDNATPVERVALARLALDPALSPPPHIREDLEAKGWVKCSASGYMLLTGRGMALVERS